MIIKLLFLISLSAPVSALSCDFPNQLPSQYIQLHQFTEGLIVDSLLGVDECKAQKKDPLVWEFKCDDQGQFLEARAKIFLLPRLIFLINKDLELEITYDYLDQWSFPKVSSSELAEVIIKQGREVRIIYTTNSARKVHLTLGRNNLNQLKTMESLLFKMNIGKPTLESKFNCSVD
ncbi:MAG: hypothetical protein K9K67_09845 [Bacteriovoracaceae bacterium]|nr:hypothetical protein [Bacteriovoracaceae bacterium]